MEIGVVNVYIIICRHVYMNDICLKPPHTRFMHLHTSVGFCISVLPNLLQVTPNQKWPIGGNAGESSSVRGELGSPGES